MSACSRERERERECVCVREREREGERESMGEWVGVGRALCEILCAFSRRKILYARETTGLVCVCVCVCACVVG